ncbi:DMT family transporter [Actinophytocola sp.]|uniref:DMT family transporter n=1 Tax=Actinophytocola sp. TaxID=1872138 RepID=UPI0025BBD36C|nr:DMT family transporter [Actinophytocola sp.]
MAGAALTAVGGVALAVQGRVNGQLGHVMRDGVFAALISFGIGTVLLVAAVSITPSARAGLIRLRTSVRGGRLRPWQCLGGACGAFLVTSQGFTVSILGVAVFTVAVVAGQVVASLAVDRAGLGPGEAQPITLPRAVGALLAVVAVVIAVSDHAAVEAGGLWWALLPAVAGLGLAWQTAVNGLVRVEAGNIVVPTLVNFSVGTGVLIIAALVDLAVKGVPDAPPGEWWYYVGGLLGMVAILTAVTAVRFTGVLLLGLSSVAGQLTGAVLLDVFLPTAGGGLSTTSLIGTAITMVAVGIAAIRR